MYTKLGDTLALIASAAVVDLVAGNPTTAYVSAANARRFAALVAAGAVAATKTVTIQFKQATDTSGTAAKNLGSAIVTTAPGGGWTQQSILAEANVTDLDVANGFNTIAVNVTSNNASAVPGSVVVAAYDNRFNP